MENIVVYAIWGSVILVGLSLLGVVLFGLRNLTYGKISPLTATIIVLPVVVLVALGFATGDWDEAAVWTTVIMIGLAGVGLLLSGVRGALGL